MKKPAALLCALILLLVLCLPALAAGSAGTVEVQFYDEAAMAYGGTVVTDRVSVVLDGAAMDFDVPAMTRTVDGVDGRTLAPVRPIAEALGASVLWIAENRQVLISRDSDTMVLTLGSSTAVVNGEKVDLPGRVAPCAAKVDGVERTLVPLRFVSEELKAQVEWDNDAFAAMVSTAAAPEPAPSPEPTSAPSPVPDPNAFTVVLDAGHGGEGDAGAEYEGVKEKDITLPITLRAAELLREKGYNVVLTRDGDERIGLYDRAGAANAAEADIFVSIHANASDTNHDFQGTFTYSFPGSSRGEKLARCIQDAVVQAAGSVDRGLLTNNYVVLRETVMPAALLETGFMSCHEELMRLVQPEYQEKLAQGVANGVEAYLSTLSAKAADTP